MKNKYSFNIKCINCDIKGHSLKECKLPITSYGILGYHIFNNNQIKFLLIQRKDSIGYIDLIRGKYNHNIKKNQILKTLIDEMTLEEKNNLLYFNFDELWNKLWVNKQSKIYTNDYYLAKIKYNSLDIQHMIKESLIDTKWLDTEYTIPKGRKNRYENKIECAIREFSEETGIDKKYINFIDSIPFEEIFFGSNGTYYKHVYYLTEITTDDIPFVNNKNPLQCGEVKNVKWFDYKEAMNVFRSYDSTKRYLIHKFNNYLLKKEKITN